MELYIREFESKICVHYTRAVMICHITTCEEGSVGVGVMMVRGWWVG